MKKIFLLLFLCCSLLINLAGQIQPTITAMEFFFNKDPGVGFGYNYTVFDPPLQYFEIDEVVEINLDDINPNDLEEGFNTLYVRILGEEPNDWSLPQGRLVYILKDEEEIMARPFNRIEYYSGADPGTGYGTIDFNDTYEKDTVVEILGEEANGFHFLYCRLTGDEGPGEASRISDAHDRMYYAYSEEELPEANPFDKIEYYFGEDQGVGAGIIIHIANTYEADTVVEVLGGEPNDFQFLYFRLTGEEGHEVSLPQGRMFYYMDLQELPVTTPISFIEYYVDTDPGPGNGEPITIPESDTIDLVIQINVAGFGQTKNSESLQLGMHDLFIRVKDTAETWSVHHAASFEYFRGISLKVFLEGPYEDTVMGTALSNKGFIPLEQPYDVSPWNYDGTESVAEIPPDVVDWVYMELHDTTNASYISDATMIDRRAAFLKKDGSVVGLDGISPLVYAAEIPVNNLYVVVWHRNHLPVLSNFGVTEVDLLFTYDFTTSADQAYGTDAQKGLPNGVFGMFGGDGNASGIVDLTDKIIWMNEAGKAGYKAVDFNLDGQTDNKDKNDVWDPNQGKGSQLPDKK